MLEALGKAWAAYPDMRLGQLVAVIAVYDAIPYPTPNDYGVVFNVEDDDMLRGIVKYAERAEGEKAARPLIQKLREESKEGATRCLRALKANDWDIKKAKEWLEKNPDKPRGER